MHLHLTPSNIPSTQTTQPNHKPTKSNLTDQMKTVSKKTTIPNKENITVPNKENIYPQPVNQQIKHRPTISLHEIQKNEPSLTIVNNMSIEEKELKKHLIKLMPDKNPALLINKFIEHLAKQQMTDLKIYDEEPKTLDRNEHYLKEYESEIIKKMHQDEPDFSNLLENTQITDSLRSKMVDWMIEIFSKYPELSSNDTYFKAVSIFNLYIKKCFVSTKKILSDCDIHLSGIAAMYLATKFEDEAHIQMKDFIQSIGHSIFTRADIKEKEWEIYSILDCDLTFPTSYTFFKFYFYKSFGKELSTTSKNLYEISVYILKLCNYVYSLVEVQPHLLAICSLLYSIKLVFNTFDTNESFNFLEIEKNMMESVLSVEESLSVEETKNCLDKINSLFTYSDSLFSKGMNILDLQREIKS